MTKTTRIKESSAYAYTASLWQISDYFYTLQWDHWEESLTYCKEDVEDNFAKRIWTKLEDSLPRTFKFRLKNNPPPSDQEIYTYHQHLGGFTSVYRSEPYYVDEDHARESVANGNWIVMPSEPEEKSDEDFTRQCIDKLNTYVGCMSYNDSYFGEPAGEFKRVIRQLDKTYNPEKKPIDTVQLKIELDGVKEAYETLNEMVKISNTTLESIKDFTSGTGHDVWIAEGIYKVFRKHEDVPYICHTDEQLIAVMDALIVLDSVETE